MKTAHRGSVLLTSFAVISGSALSMVTLAVEAGGKLTCSIGDPAAIGTNTPVHFAGVVSDGKSPDSYQWMLPNTTPGTVAANPASTTFTSVGSQTVTLDVTDVSNKGGKTCSASLGVTVAATGGIPNTRGGTYETPAGGPLTGCFGRTRSVPRFVPVPVLSTIRTSRSRS